MTKLSLIIKDQFGSIFFFVIGIYSVYSVLGLLLILFGYWVLAFAVSGCVFTGEFFYRSNAFFIRFGQLMILLFLGFELEIESVEGDH